MTLFMRLNLPAFSQVEQHNWLINQKDGCPKPGVLKFGMKFEYTKDEILNLIRKGSP